MPWVLLLLVNVGEMMSAAAAEPSVARPGKRGLEFIHVSKEGRHFVLSSSGSEFRPWGFNYDHDAANRLLETYWKEDWKAVAGDFGEMKQLGANTVRIHLQASRFMKSAQETNRESLEQLARLIALAETTGLYLGINSLTARNRWRWVGLAFTGAKPSRSTNKDKPASQTRSRANGWSISSGRPQPY